MTGRKKSGARKRRTLLGESVELVYAFLRRRLIRPRPARAAPKIARLAGSGTTAALLNRRKLSGPSSAFRIVASRAIVVQLLPVPMCPPHAVSRCDVEGKTSAAITQVHTCVRKHEVAEIIDGGDQTLAVSGLPTNRARLVDAALLTSIALQIAATSGQATTVVARHSQVRSARCGSRPPRDTGAAFRVSLGA